MKRPSYERVDYTVRPAKSIERKMLCEALVRLGHFRDLTQYRYVGLGSIFFSDFILIHKSLGIKDLISIEREVGDKKRFEFNCPYKFIKLLFGNSNDVLLYKLEWTKKLILWLDYDYKLNENVFRDISIFSLNAKSGSIILLTIDVEPDDSDKDEETGKHISRCDKLAERIGISKIPLGTEEKDLLDSAGFQKVCFEIIDNEINRMISMRNDGKEYNDKLKYKQLFNFLYKDGSAQMLSVGGIICSQNDEKKIQDCNFEKLKFINSAIKPYEIVVPKLTFREVRYLDKKLSLKKSSVKKKRDNLSFLSEEMKENYSKIYRYFPTFVEAEIH